jgi:hypothetical protein
MIRRSPLKRSTKPIRKRRPGPPRRGPADIPPEEWRNPEYLDFLREEGYCRACRIQPLNPYEYSALDTGRFGMDPMHGPPNGGSQKGPDTGAIPGCRTHHDEQTRIGWPAFEAKYGFSREAEAAKWYRKFQLQQERA